MLIQYTGAIRLFLFRSSLVVASTLMLTVSSGCNATDPNMVASDSEEAAQGGEANAPATPDWATFDLRTTNSDLNLTEPWLVFVDDGSGLPDADLYQVGRIEPPGIFTFDVTSTPPNDMLQPFELAWFRDDDGLTREGVLVFSNSEPNLLVLPLFRLPARAAANDAFLGHTVKLVVPESDAPFAALIYSDRATGVDGEYVLKDDGVADGKHVFDLRLAQGYNVIKAESIEGDEGFLTTFNSDLGSLVPTWFLDEPTTSTAQP